MLFLQRDVHINVDKSIEGIKSFFLLNVPVKYTHQINLYPMNRGNNVKNIFMKIRQAQPRESRAIISRSSTNLYATGESRAAILAQSYWKFILVYNFNNNYRRLCKFARN